MARQKPFNYMHPDWAVLNRALALCGMPPEVSCLFMWMFEQPMGVHHYKHYDTRRYSILRADSTLRECQEQLANAFMPERTDSEIKMMTSGA